MKIVVGQSKCI